MGLFRNREKEVRGLIRDYFSIADQAIEEFQKVIGVYLDGGSEEDLHAGDRRIHAFESQADDLRITIEKELYSQALLPESRGDILGLLESFDKMPNMVETITFMLSSQRIVIPEERVEDFKTLVGINLEAYRLVRTTVDNLFDDPSSVEASIQPVDTKESESDVLERAIIVAVFRSSIDPAHMLLLRELTERIGDISDNAERVARRLEIISLKKRL